MTIATHISNKITTEDQQTIKRLDQLPASEHRLGPYTVWIHVSLSQDIAEVCDYIGYPAGDVSEIVALQSEGDYDEVWVCEGRESYLDASKYTLVFRQ